MKPFLHALLAIGLFSGLGVSPAAAAQSEWEIGDFHRARLLLVSGKGRSLRGGLEIALDEGWYTYWRVPGDAGIPPQLDFSGSVNIANVVTFYPVPERHVDGSGVSLIYSGQVTLPLEVKAIDPNLPATLNVSALFGVCDAFCIPAKAKLSVTLAPDSGDDPPARIAIEQAQRRVPGQPQAGQFDVESARREGEEIVIQVRTPEAVHVDLFAEGPENWFLGQPALISRAGPIARYRLPLDGMPEGETVRGRTFTFVAVADGKAIEKPVPID